MTPTSESVTTMREPTLEDVRVAAKRLRGVVARTPLLYPETPGTPLAGAMVLKPENLQVTGSFKPRGAYNKMASLAPEGRARGVVAYSSGNHAQGVAYAARLLGVPATVVMPENAIPAKLAATQALGATVVQVGTTSQERLEYAVALAQREDKAIVPAYDDPAIVAGQGTIGLEILEDMQDVRAVVVCLGGGGMLAGIALAIKSQRPDVRVIGVEPEGAADGQASLRAGHIVTWERIETIADGLRATHLGDLPFALISRLVDDIVTVSEEEVRAATLALHRTARLVVEPSGAVAVAALMHGKTGVEGWHAVATVSGGNVDPTLLRSWLENA